eukprot:14167715-Ditylum_brightwellii.AAC.1
MDEPSYKTTLDVPKKTVAVQERVPPQQHTRPYQKDITTENYRTVRKTRHPKNPKPVPLQSLLGRMGKQNHNTNDLVDTEKHPLYK